jgi:hypothetical protein
MVAIGMSLLSCSNDTGKLTISGLDEFNGKWVIAKCTEDEIFLLAAFYTNNIWDVTGAKISNGSAILNVWKVNENFDWENYDESNGNNVTFEVFVVNTQSFLLNSDEFNDFVIAVGSITVTFTDGNAAGSFFIQR